MATERSLKVAREFFGSWELNDVIEAVVEDLAALLDRELLTEGSVAVDREKLREVLENRDFGANCSFCRYSGCERAYYGEGDTGCTNRPHSPDCPLGGDDAD